MTTRFHGLIRWGTARRDNEGHREYHPVFLIECDQTDGPANAMQTPGLPIPGSLWAIGGDIDVYAWCHFDATITPRTDKGNYWFEVEMLFSTRPLTGQTGAGWPGTGGSGGGGSGPPPGGGGGRCNDQHVEDPLLEPIKISGGSVRYQEELAEAQSVSYLRDGAEIRKVEPGPVTNSSHELFRGPQNEWDANRATFRVEQNYPILEYDEITALLDGLNAEPIWGFPARSIKFSRFDWSLQLYGLCYFYFTRVFEFEVRTRLQLIAGDFVVVGDWDRELLDEGTRLLNGTWNTETGAYKILKVGGAFPDKLNPSHFSRSTDKSGNPTRYVLDGEGLPANAKLEDHPLSQTEAGNAAKVKVEGYLDVDFLTFGL